MAKTSYKQCSFKVKSGNAFYPSGWILFFNNEMFSDKVKSIEEFFIDFITNSFNKEDFDCFVSDKDINLINKNTLVI